MNAARRTDQAVPDSSQQQVEQLFALCYVLSSRIAEVEATVARVCTAFDLDPPPPTLGADWTTIKQAAHRTGFTESGIRHRIAQGKIVVAKRGRRVLIKVASLSSKKTK